MKIARFKLGILGTGGRMGAELDKLLAEPRFSARLERFCAPVRGAALDPFFGADVWVEFSSPAAALELVREALRRGSKIPLVVGATGWSEPELRELETAAKILPILRSANFSLGVQICRLTLQSWGARPIFSGWKVTIRDLHHVNKKDAPSGTALALREALGSALGRNATIESERIGDAVGTHEVILESASEKLTLIHEAKTRGVFAEGALEAALRLANSTAEQLPKRLLSLDDL